jgi:hypothetical protein
MATKHQEIIETVSSLPEKDFFVSMLTRDIDLQDAILDLLDNCVDGAIRTRSKEDAESDSFSGFWAKVSYSPTKFSIEDNCGGIPWSIAKDYAFRMGRPADVKTEAGTIGVVGIGMKRAIFKMGRKSYVHSHHEKDTYRVTINPNWFENDVEWPDFEAHREKPIIKEHGTLIEIADLVDGSKLAFKKSSTFSQNFPDIVVEAYSYLIEKGFTVFINGKRIKPKTTKLHFESVNNLNAKSHLIRPFMYSWNTNGVNIFLAVGYRSPIKTQEELAKESELTYAAKDAGWTIVCNDRVVLSNDRTVKTGWGLSPTPNFHNQFSCIAGIVEFKSKDISKLPITTTKRGVDTSNDIYTLVRQKMQEGLRHFTRNTNRWKGFESELKKRFEQANLLELSDLKSIEKRITVSKTTYGRQFKPDLPEKVVIKTTRRISFIKKINEIEQVSNYLFDEIRETDEVGEACFDRILERSK